MGFTWPKNQVLPFLFFFLVIGLKIKKWPSGFTNMKSLPPFL
jgi:hypothetical protein